MTYSIVARDPETGDMGVAVQSRYFGAGRIVPWAEAGVGAIASQSLVNESYGPEGLKLLRAGASAEVVVQALTGADPQADIRQLAVLDARGGLAVHTGASCVAAAGHRIAASCAAQANMMRRDSVWPAMTEAFESTLGPLAERMLAALEAAEREGGDVRGRQAAGLVVVGGAADVGRLIDLRVDDHPDPIGELKRQLALWRALERADRALSRLARGDLAGAAADLDAACASHPEEPEFLSRRALLAFGAGQADEAREFLRRACAADPGWADFTIRWAEAGFTPFPVEAVRTLVAGLGPPSRS